VATSPDLKDARRRIEVELEEALDPERLKKIIDVALSTEKNAWGDFSCKSCGKHQRQMVKVPDTVSVAKVLEVLLNQSKGRPTEAQEDDHVTVNYYVITRCDHGRESVSQNGKLVESVEEAARIITQAENGARD
jgi:hypothetical protein